MPVFKVIRASAGSGKTFNLAGEYLRLLFSEPEAFLHILAVTFTNKATEEMKSRIINELFALASGESSAQLDGLIKAVGLSEAQIRNRAANILKRILHRYSGFSVNTIDSFFQRIIRSFTRELGIQEGYSIELDTEYILREAINRLLIQAGDDKTLLSWLSQYAESLIEKGESWDLRKGIFGLGHEIFREEFKALNDSSVNRFSDKAFLHEFRKELYALQTQLTTTYKSFGTKALSLIDACDLVVDDFSGKSKGPAGFLVSLANGGFKEPTATAINASMNAEKWYTAASTNKKLIEDLANKALMPLMQQVVEFYSNNHKAYHSASLVLKNLYTLGILIDLSEIVAAWCNENNTFLLNEAPDFLNRIINGNDTPFIYEKAGYWFHHFMMDEFQDTSLLQWLNFKPLISNSLSQDYDNLAVGDTKQSIYRWRNSNWEILESRINQDFSPGIVQSVTLQKNWRSKSNIIEFNNRFFKSASDLLQQEFESMTSGSPLAANFGSISDLYKGMEQIPGNADNKGGIVRVESICEDEDSGFCDLANEKLLRLIDDLLEKGYQLKDIAILTRKKSEARYIADFFLQHNAEVGNNKRRLDIISDEALILGNSITVNFVISLLRYIIDPEDKTNTYYLAVSFPNYLDKAGDSSLWINNGEKEGNIRLPLFRYPEEFGKLIKNYESFALVELVNQLIKIFDLERHRGEQVYLLALVDLIIEYSHSYGCDISRFLEFWDESGSDRSVAAPASQDAIRILTLHKSKGLEFKITIIPYCTWDLNTFNKSFLWCSTAEPPFDKLPVMPLSYSKPLKKTVFEADFYREYFRQLVDNLNLLYVAFTRAQEGLFVFCKEKNEDEQLTTVSGLSGKILGKDVYHVGEIFGNDTHSAVSNPVTEGYKPADLSTVLSRMRIAFQGRLLIDPTVNKPLRPVNQGKILHELFSFMNSRDDIQPAINRMHLQGKISADEIPEYKRFVENAMNDIQVADWFSGDRKIVKEAEIILPDGNMKRPDRVMISEKQTILVDYKFGEKNEPGYEQQVKEYAGILREMGYPGIEAYIWYVKLGKIVQCMI